MDISPITGKRKERDTDSLDQNKVARVGEYSMRGFLGTPSAAAQEPVIDELVYLNGIMGLKKDEDNPFKKDMLAQLKELSNQLLTIAKTEKETEQAMLIKFQQIKDEFDAAFNSALENAITTLNLTEQTAEAEEAERMMSEEDKLQRARQARNNFLENMRNITDRMTMELTVGQQAEMFQYIEEQIKKRLEKEHNLRKEQEPNHLARLSEVSSIALSYTLQQLSVTVTNVYNTGPKLATQIIATITAGTMIYNYLPEGIRYQFTVIPYFGPIFKIMNIINPHAVLVQNSVATVTTIFYLLRNAGMDHTESVAALGAMTRETIGFCAEEMKRYICNTTTMARANLQNIGANLETAATTVLSNIANRLGDLLTSEYQEQVTFLEDSQVSLDSLGNSTVVRSTVASPREVQINASINTASSQETLKSVEILLDTQVTDGGIDLSGMAIPSTIVDDRFTIIASPVQVANVAMPVAEVEQYFESQETADSSLTSDSSDLFAPWFWGRGGRRIKKSRRQIKNKITKRKRKGKKARTTKKGRKQYRTLKRYNPKMRR